MPENTEDPWQTGTWEGSRREELRRWRALSLKEKLDAVQELNALGATLIAARKARGLPYIDPVSGERVGAAKQ